MSKPTREHRARARTWTRRAIASTWILCAGLIALAGCGGARERGADELVVFAASSLTEAFQALERGFERANPGVDVRLAFAGSQVLRLQIEQGAAADVFASANEQHMRALVDAGLVTRSEIFAENELVVIVPARGSSVERFEQLDQATRIVIGTESVPVGVYTRQVLDRVAPALGEGFAAALRERVVSEENNVRLVRAKIELGEADAAFVYRTDATASTRVRVVPIPDALNVRASYPIGLVQASPRAALAARFLDYTRSAEGRAALRRHGFLAEAP
ncbi:MAG: molybdate ABC transporter substrate-binding protein [Myxococcales bacterium]|nr:molybdate ABC transporter substrate-binding protein [Myxococcales bacterium]